MHRPYFCTCVTSIWKSVRTWSALFFLSTDMLHKKCPTHSQYYFGGTSYIGAFSNPELRCTIFIFLCLISDLYFSKEKGKQNSKSIWTAQWKSYWSVPVGYTVVIDWLTRAEWFLSPWGMRRTLCSLLWKKKIQVEQKRIIRNVSDFNTILVTCPKCGKHSLY